MTETVVGGASGTTGLTDEHRLAIAETLVGREVDFDRLWRDLEEYVRGFQTLHRRRAQNPPEVERNRWRRIDKLTSDLAGELREVRGPASDPLWPNHLLAALREAKRKAEAHIAYYEIARRAFGGQQDPYCEFLYRGVLRIWTDIVGGELKYSRPPAGGPPFGPLVRFVTVCLRPILADDMPGPHGVAAIIDREKRDRAHTNMQGLQAR
jgi:hypothetical protein